MKNVCGALMTVLSGTKLTTRILEFVSLAKGTRSHGNSGAKIFASGMGGGLGRH